MQKDLIQDLAQRADCDPRSARRWLLGESLRPLLERRLARAASSLGLHRQAMSISAASELMAIDGGTHAAR